MHACKQKRDIRTRGEHRAGPDPTPTSPTTDIAGKPNRFPTRNQSDRYRDGRDRSNLSVLFVVFRFSSRPDPIPTSPITDIAGKPNRLPTRLLVGIGNGPSGWSESGRISGGGRFCSALIRTEQIWSLWSP